MSAAVWFYAENENRQGPVPLERIADLIMSGGLDRGALVWRHGMPDWTEAGSVPEIESLLPPPLPPPLPPGKAAPRIAAPAPAAEPRPAAEPKAAVEPKAPVTPPVAEPKPEAPPAPEAKPAARGRRPRTEAEKNIADLPTLDANSFRGLADALVEKTPEPVPPPAPVAASAPAPKPAPEPAPKPAPVPPPIVEQATPPAPPPIVQQAAPQPPAPPPASEAIVIEEEPDGPKMAWPSGRLADHEFAEIIREVHGRRWTGLLTLNHGGIEKTVRIQEGRLVFASSSSQDDRLGELLLRRGRITLEQFVEAGRGIRKGKRLGAVLVEMGALDPRELVKIVVDHTQEIIYGAFQWTEGSYHLTETSDPAEPIVLRLSTPDIILEGIRRIDRWSRIERAVGNLETRYDRADGYEGLIKQMTLSPDKLALLTGFNPVQDLASICKRSTMPHFEICRTLWAYSVIGVLRRLD